MPELLVRSCPKECPYIGTDWCDLCTSIEIFIRYYIHATDPEPMTPEEREWCVKDADQSAEGALRVQDLIQLSDKDLAKAVLSSWQMYVTSNFNR